MNQIVSPFDEAPCLWEKLKVMERYYPDAFTALRGASWFGNNFQEYGNEYFFNDLHNWLVKKKLIDPNGRPIGGLVFLMRIYIVKQGLKNFLETRWYQVKQTFAMRP